METGHERRAPLSPHYAFVVQWATDTHIEAGQLSGRVEHVVSRCATHFTSLEGLLAFMAQVLQNVAERERLAQAEADKLSASNDSLT